MPRRSVTGDFVLFVALRDEDRMRAWLSPGVLLLIGAFRIVAHSARRGIALVPSDNERWEEDPSRWMVIRPCSRRR